MLISSGLFLEGLPFAQDLSLENSADSYCFQLALPLSVSYFFFLYQSSSSSLCKIFYSISSNIGEVFSINPSANAFVFRDFNIHHKDWLNYSGGNDRHGELYYNFSFFNDLTQMVNFPTRIPDCESHSSALLDFFWRQYLFYNGFPFIGKFWSCCCLSFHWLSIKLKTGCWDVIKMRCDHLRDVPWENIFRFGASAAASEFCE